MLTKIKYRFNILAKLVPFAKSVKRFFVLGFILNLVTMVLEFINPLVYKKFLDEVILNGKIDKMILIVIGYLSIFLANAIISYVRNYANYTLVNTILYRVKNKIWQEFFKYPFYEYENMSVGDMKMRLDDDTEQIRNFASNQTIDYFISFITLIISLVVLFIIDYRLTVLAIIVIPLTLFLDHVLSKKEAILNDGNRENDQNLSSWLHATVQGWREIKALNLHDTQEKRFEHYLDNYSNYYWKWVNIWTIRVLIIPKIKDQFFMQFGLYFFGGILIINGKLSISNLLIFSMYFNMLYNAVKTLSSTDAELQANIPLTDRFIEALEPQNNIDLESGIIPDDKDTIVLDRVSFTYPNTEKEILHDFSLKIEKGERIAITGKSGAGKSTILKLITGMISPTKGSVYFSDINVKDINMPAMHSRIGFVMQENMLFNATIKENLLYGRNDATDAELIEACKKAYIYDYISELPDRLDTVIGEKGIKLSGGQRQRIVLARLFLRDVDIYIFDEATSALDQYSENIVQDAIRNIAKDKTIIVVAHRESSINLCERKIAI